MRCCTRFVSTDSIRNSRLLVNGQEVLLFRTADGYAATCPQLPGVWSQGATEEEALTFVAEAIEAYFRRVSVPGESPPRS
ncbi:MAG: hypothetical protein GMKNLPBB_02145 [Myxococcota bacterium]|nr:hypothetical protein [Myxococcota bacterium]